MAILVEVDVVNAQSGEEKRNTVKYIPKELAVFFGSAGWGGIKVDDPIEAAKADMRLYNECDDVTATGFIIDTLAPEWSTTHRRRLSA